MCFHLLFRQYVGNIPGNSAPTGLTDGEANCSDDPTQPCEVKLVGEKVSTYYTLDNRVPEEDERSPSFDAFDNLVSRAFTRFLSFGDKGLQT